MRIISYLEERVLTQIDPRSLASCLSGDMNGFYRYRVGDYRIITSIDHGKMVVLALEMDTEKTSMKNFITKFYINL